MSKLPPSSLSSSRSDLPPSSSSNKSSSSSSSDGMKQKYENEKDTTTANNKLIGPPPIQFIEFATKYIIRHLHNQYPNHHYKHHYLAAEEEENQDEHKQEHDDVVYEEDEEEYSLGSTNTSTSCSKNKLSLRDRIYQQANQEAESILNNCCDYSGSISIDMEHDSYNDDTNSISNNNSNSEMTTTSYYPFTSYVESSLASIITARNIEWVESVVLDIVHNNQSNVVIVPKHHRVDSITSTTCSTKKRKRNYLSHNDSDSNIDSDSKDNGDGYNDDNDLCYQ